MDKEYRAAKGAMFGQEAAARFGREIELVTAKAGGITPAGVLQLARKKKSAMRDFFDWDNEIAGPKWRLNQARHILGHLLIRVGEGEEGREMKAFHNLDVAVEQGNPEPKFVKLYVETEQALSQADLRAQMIAGALEEVNGWRQRYSDYCELAGVFKAIDRVEKATA